MERRDHMPAVSHNYAERIFAIAAASEIGHRGDAL